MKSVEPKSLAKVIAHIEAGGRVAIPTMTRVTVIDNKCLARFRKAGAWLLKEDGDGYRMQSGKGSVYVLAGQMVYA